jgi:hypothetical protein
MLFTPDDLAQINRYKQHTARYKLKLKCAASNPKSAAARGGAGGRGGGGGGGGSGVKYSKASQDGFGDFMQTLQGGERFG